MKDDKWVIFKNYLHNELGITKEDIREWIGQAVEEQVKRYVDNEFSRRSVEQIATGLLKTEIKDDLKWRISNEISRRFFFKEPEQQKTF